MAFDTGLAFRVTELLNTTFGISEKKMFGGLAYLYLGHMFVGIVGDKLMVRVGKARYSEALSLPHVTVMDFTKKPLTGYVYVAAPALMNDDALADWVFQALSWVKTLPPKK